MRRLYRNCSHIRAHIHVRVERKKEDERVELDRVRICVCIAVSCLEDLGGVGESISIRDPHLEVALVLPIPTQAQPHTHN